MKGGGPAGAALVVALALALVLSACGGGDGAGARDGVASLGDTSSEASGAASSKDRREGALDFAQCMREHGIDHPDPDENGMFRIEPNQGFDPRSGRFREAAEACEEHLGSLRPPPELSAEDRKRMEEQMLAFAKCMRAQGIDMPDPTFGGEGGGFALELPRDLDPNDPDFRAAQQACREHSPEAALPAEGS